MSKSNMLLGLAKGKVGDLVFYRDGGEQRTRTRVIPKNPRTSAQMTQRVKIANVSGIYRAATDILRDSFVNRPSNQSGYNAFASRAIALSPYITREMAIAGAVIPQPAMASKGTLPSVPFNVAVGNDYVGPYVTINFTATETTTIGEVAQAILAQAPWFTPMAELHFCTLVFEASQSANLDVDVYNVIELHSVFKLDTNSTALLSSSGFEVVDNQLQPVIGAPGDETAIYMAVVLQSLVGGDGSLNVSTQHFKLSPAATTLYEGYRTAASLQQAIESYNASEEISLR